MIRQRGKGRGKKHEKNALMENDSMYDDACGL